MPFLSPGYLPDPGIEPKSPTLQADPLPSKPPGRGLGLTSTLLETSKGGHYFTLSCLAPVPASLGGKLFTHPSCCVWHIVFPFYPFDDYRVCSDIPISFASTLIYFASADESLTERVGVVHYRHNRGGEEGGKTPPYLGSGLAPHYS